MSRPRPTPPALAAVRVGGRDGAALDAVGSRKFIRELRGRTGG